MGSTEEGNKKFLILFLFMLRLCFGNSGLLCRAKMLIFCLIQCCFLLRLYERVKSARPHYSSGGPRGQVAITIAFILVKLIKLFNKQLSLYIYIFLSGHSKVFFSFFFFRKTLSSGSFTLERSGWWWTLVYAFVSRCLATFLCYFMMDLE